MWESLNDVKKIIFFFYPDYPAVYDHAYAVYPLTIVIVVWLQLP
jgi:hypothetical protein